MGKNLNVPKHIASGPGERIDTTVLKRRKRIETVHADKVRRSQAQERSRQPGKYGGKQQKRALKKQVFKNARDFMNKHKRQADYRKVLARRLRKETTAGATRFHSGIAEKYKGKVLFVIRLEGKHIPPVMSQMMKRLGLRAMHEARFHEITPALLRDLQMLRGFVVWGFPTPEHIGQLLRTRAYLKNQSGQRVPLSGNALVEDILGEHGLICIEDMEHSIREALPNLQHCLEALDSFRLTPPSKDQSEKDRRGRDRALKMGKGTFASYLVHTMPELPAPREGEDPVVSFGVQRELQSKQPRRPRGADRPPLAPRPEAKVQKLRARRKQQRERRRERRAAAAAGGEKAAGKEGGGAAASAVGAAQPAPAAAKRAREEAPAQPAAAAPAAPKAKKARAAKAPAAAAPAAPPAATAGKLKKKKRAA
eukprot:TRINITY_DN6609_c0_g2_i1.p2 TRINITY_DN6609_c0_g2~~TRINITY_DN6609_c0_g2_i1.p2  ORF type:complete len:423 (+),score=164.11 TRINITY_DN6609_c0_g2_i1:120-1388(+)